MAATSAVGSYRHSRTGRKRQKPKAKRWADNSYDTSRTLPDLVALPFHLPLLLLAAFVRILDRIIRRFLRDRDVVRMALGHARATHPAESCIAAKTLDVFRAAISHARTQAAHELIDEITQRPTIRHASFDAFGHHFARRRHIGLAVAVFRALDHRPHATHAAVGFVAPALMDDKLARRFIQAGKQRAHHARTGTC